MFVVMAWFADRIQSAESVAHARQRFDAAVSALVPESFLRLDSGGDDWGLTVLRAPDEGAWRWPLLAEADGVTAVSLGVPIGLDATTGSSGPVRLALRLLQGDDVHVDVVPAFGLIAVEGGHRFAIQQDWLGMCRLFIGESAGVTVFGNRPSLVAKVLGGPEGPDHDGWASYAACGHFGGESSPVRGVRLLGPGHRVTGRRRDGGGWDLTAQTRFCVDDVIKAGIAARGGGLDEAMDMAAHGLATTGSSVGALYDAPITLGLSGGRDSRLIAASLIAGGRLPEFHTNVDMAAEGDTARVLLDILRDRRGLDPSHRLFRVGSQSVVLKLGLRERVLRLQGLYDYQFPSTYTVRFPGPARLPVKARPVSFSGAGGELATGYWYPADQSKTNPAAGRNGRMGRSAAAAAMRSLLASGGDSAVTEAVRTRETARIGRLLDHGEALGLRGLELVDLVYLLERVRRWYSSAYFVGMVTPFLSPSFVAASFALSPEGKRNRSFHTGLLDRFLPEWTDVPYVSGSTGPSTAVRISAGDGLEVLHGLLDTTHGTIASLLRRDAVAAALVECAGGRGSSRSHKILQHFAYLAVASQQLEPDGVRAATGSYAAFMRATATGHRPRSLVPAPLSRIAGHLGFLKNTWLGRWAWSRIRMVVVRMRRRVLARAAQRPASLLPGRWRYRSRTAR
jgi:asparagine synthase (glutamine-hydrolysing)